MQLSWQRWIGSGASRQLVENISRPLMKLPSRSSAVVFSLLLLLGGALISTRLLDSNNYLIHFPHSSSQAFSSSAKTLTASKITLPDDIPKKHLEIPLNCTALNHTGTCPVDYPTLCFGTVGMIARSISFSLIGRFGDELCIRPEINIKPWEGLQKELKEGNKRKRWMEREAYAYWKGNPAVAETRMDLMKCNVSEEHDWNARVFAQDWVKESQQGYKQSDLANQCLHRYKIYIEGSAWSVSQKYIMACDSVTLIVKPHYYDFFTRSLVPVHHYWPIQEHDKCKSIKFAVDWGNSHKQKAQEIGMAASSFIQDELKMDFVYDYMLHLLTQYSKLLTFKPVVPKRAVELCSESMACNAAGLEKKFMMESLVKGPSERAPCTIPTPYDPPSLSAVLRRNSNSIKQVELWEKRYWDNQNKQQQQA
ncbi:unnamed protein product [Linum tenue]|uniref:Glycosyl transferase CAP10 domain-containing protein n=1 Tax=Linum tenue TaxID=586396 RepID=A0AAV0J499_9ROSI|nr:unnamed protein product [Linum tenue]